MSNSGNLAGRNGKTLLYGESGVETTKRAIAFLSSKPFHQSAIALLVPESDRFFDLWKAIALPTSPRAIISNLDSKVFYRKVRSLLPEPTTPTLQPF